MQTVRTAHRQFGGLHGVAFKIDVETSRLILHFHHELVAVDGLRKARIVFDIGRLGKQSARKRSGDNERVQSGASGIERRGQSGRTGSDKNQISHNSPPLVRF